jgi:hypothetical protein
MRGVRAASVHHRGPQCAFSVSGRVQCTGAITAAHAPLVHACTAPRPPPLLAPARLSCLLTCTRVRVSATARSDLLPLPPARPRLSRTWHFILPPPFLGCIGPGSHSRPAHPRLLRSSDPSSAALAPALLGASPRGVQRCRRLALLQAALSPLAPVSASFLGPGCSDRSR